MLHGGEPVVIAGALEISEEHCQVITDDVLPLVQARADAIRQAHVRVPLGQTGRDGLAELREILASHPGPCDAFLHLVRPDETETVLALPQTLRVAASEQIVDAIETVLGAGAMTFR